MKLVAGALAGLTGLALSSAGVAQPAGRIAGLHEFVSPLALYPDAEFQFQRSVAEHQAGAGTFVIVPMFRALVLPDGNISMVPASVVRAPLFKYDDLQDREADVVEFTRQAAQDLVDRSILPAARRVEGLTPFSFQSVSVTVRDLEDAAIAAPRWSPASSAAPVIVIKYGLNHSIQLHAHVALQFDRVLRLPRDAPPDLLSDSLSKFTNTYVAVYLSSRQSRRDGRQFFDRGMWDAIHPVEWSLEDRRLYLAHSLSILEILLAHETCHHILGHTSSPTGDRRAQEMKADICAAAIFVEARAAQGGDTETRLRLYVEAAQYISIASMINWPVGVTTRYPAPDERYQAILASIPLELRQAEPELAAAIDQLLPFTAPLAVLANADLNLPLIPNGESGAGQIYDALLDTFYFIRDASVAANCSTDPVVDRVTAFYCARLEIDRAAITVELILMRGYAAIQDLAAINLAIALVDGYLEEFSFPGISADLERLRADVASTKELPTFDGAASGT